MGDGAAAKRPRVEETQGCSAAVVVNDAVDEDEAEEDVEEDQAQNDESSLTPDDAPLVARCSFSQAENAKSAVSGLAEVEGAKVDVVLLDGSDEEAFWEKLNDRRKCLYDKGADKGKGKLKGKNGKVKGKDGKGKGKDKSKGK